MSILVNRSRASVALAICALTSFALAGCNKLIPNGPSDTATLSDTMTLLRTGSEKVCVSPDVQASLKGMIIPKPEDIAGDGSTEDKLSAIGTISLGYELTTLQAFDQAVAKATCNTTLDLTSNIDNKPEKIQITFEVSPAAENPNTFIITANTNEAQADARMMMAAAVAKTAQERDQQQQAAQQAQLDAQLRSTVSERWLKGVWIPSNAQATTCATSDAVRFEDGHVLMGGLGNGRWSLSGTHLHIIATLQGQASDNTYDIQSADAVSFGAGLPDTDVGDISLRRCTGDELRATPEPGAPVQVISDGSGR